ncbi:MAG: threonine synthase [Ruminococcaceae bacterium]|nr:threonine synthase [Oscillospiraceae bacterium]
MNYHSTRNHTLTADAAKAVLQGLAPDGGLYITDRYDGFDWQGTLRLDTLGMAKSILSALLPEIQNMDELVERAYRGRFETDELTPTVRVGDKYVLELFRGPTSAFKDVALSMLPQLITASKAQEAVSDEILILTATSGDTGKAALSGFRDVEGTKIIVFYPDAGVSAVQKAQMVTQEGKNVCVCAVRGNFDDTQTGVKKIFAAGVPGDCGVRLSSANSINIGRLAPQVVYYFKAYADLLREGRIALGDKVDYVVPTGNFGDILAGYLAKRMGLPVGTLVCASNQNDVLTDFLKTGTYDRRRPFYRTISPSMDILVSSNLERLLYLLCEDCDEVAAYMRKLNEDGCYTVSQALLEKLHAEFSYGCCGDEETKRTIGRIWSEQHYLMDTHTAVAWRVAEDHKSENPVVVLSTASAYKFPAAVLSALGETVSNDEFEVMHRLHEVTGVPIPKALAELKNKQALHTDVIDREQMQSYVLSKIEAWK